MDEPSLYLQKVRDRDYDASPEVLDAIDKVARDERALRYGRPGRVHTDNGTPVVCDDADCPKPRHYNLINENRRPIADVYVLELFASGDSYTHGVYSSLELAQAAGGGNWREITSCHWRNDGYRDTAANVTLFAIDDD